MPPRFWLKLHVPSAQTAVAPAAVAAAYGSVDADCWAAGGAGAAATAEGWAIGEGLGLATPVAAAASGDIAGGEVDVVSSQAAPVNRTSKPMGRRTLTIRFTARPSNQTLGKAGSNPALALPVRDSSPGCYRVFEAGVRLWTHNSTLHNGHSASTTEAMARSASLLITTSHQSARISSPSLVRSGSEPRMSAKVICTLGTSSL